MKPPTDVNPVPWLLGLLTVAVGAPFVAVSTTSPLLQKWFAASGHRYARDPYFLYAASNAGSMVGLWCYPTIVEPWLRLKTQSWLWSGGYGVFCLVLALAYKDIRELLDLNPIPTLLVSMMLLLGAFVLFVLGLGFQFKGSAQE